MKAIKPLRLSFLHKVFDHKRQHYFVPSIVAYFPFDSPKALLPEVELWKFLGAELGRFGVFDHFMWKPQGEVLVTGACFPPGGEAKPWSYVRLTLGSIDKTLYVLGDRTWGAMGPSDPAPFTRMPVDYERAFGGEKFGQNPVGKGFAPIKTETGATAHPLPNVEDPRQLIKAKGDRPGPASLGPWDITWPYHFAKMGTYDEKWLKEQFPGFALDMSYSLFNVAPPDQRIQGYFAGDEAFRIENMHADKRVVESRLPAVIARCFVRFQPKYGGELVEIPMHLDTVHLFPHVERGVLIFRGLREINEADASDIAQGMAALEDIDSERRPVSHYMTVLEQRLDKEKAHLYMLRDRDLMPESLSAAPGTAVAPPTDALDSIVQTEDLLRKNARRKMERELEEAKKKIRGMGLNPDEMPQLKLPPEEDQQTPDLEKLPEVVEKLTADAEKYREEAIKEVEKQEEKLRAMCEEQGLKLEDLVEKAQKESGGPPKFSAAAEIEKLRDMAELASNAETEIPGVREQLEDPTFAERLAQMEAELHKMYRISAHHQPPAPRMAAAESERARKEVAQAHARGESLSGRDFTGVDLSGLDLRGIDLSGAYLENSNLTGTDLTGANLRDAVLARADLSGAKLAQANLVKANLGRVLAAGTELDEADLTDAIFYEADLRGARLVGARLTGAQLLEVFIEGADFSGVTAEKLFFLRTNLQGMKCAGAKLIQCNFIEADVSGVDFSGADLTACGFITTRGDGAVFKGATIENLRLVKDCSFEGANFSGAHMPGSNLRATKLKGSDFSGANLRRSDLSEADLSGSNFYRAVLVDCRLMRSDLGNASMVAANLMLAVLHSANLRGADLRGSNMFAADLTGSIGDQATSFEGANVKRVVVAGGQHAKG